MFARMAFRTSIDLMQKVRELRTRKKWTLDDLASHVNELEKNDPDRRDQKPLDRRHMSIAETDSNPSRDGLRLRALAVLQPDREFVSGYNEQVKEKA